MAAASPMLREFRERGFVVAPRVFEPAEMASLAELVQRVVGEQEQLLRDDDAALLATPGRHGGRPTPEAPQRRATVEVGPDGSLAWELTRPTRFYPEHAAFRALALDPRLAALASELLGGEALVYADQAFLKPPGVGGPRPLHQVSSAVTAHPPRSLRLLLPSRTTGTSASRTATTC